jgi:hypothetical protein
MRWLLGVTLIALAGCTSMGVMPHGTGTTTDLKRANFRIVKANVRGEDSGFWLLGFIPVTSPSISNAMDRLQSQVGSEGRAVTLVNVVQERQDAYFVLFSIPRVVIRGDAVEFLPETTAQLRRDPDFD